MTLLRKDRMENKTKTYLALGKMSQDKHLDCTFS